MIMAMTEIVVVVVEVVVVMMMMMTAMETSTPRLLSMTCNVIQESLQRHSAARSTDQPAVQPNRHHFGTARQPLLQKAIKRVFEVDVELLAAVEALGRCKSHVVTIKSVGHDQVGGWSAGVWRPVEPANV